MISVNIPYWVLVAGVGAGLWWILNWRVRAIATWVLAAVMAGFLHIPALSQAVHEVQKLVQ